MRLLSKPDENPSSGLTLLELLVVLAIMGLLIAVVPQAIAGLPGFRLHAAATGLADTLRAVRDDAIRTSRPTTFTLDAAQSRYRTTGMSDWRKLPAIVDNVAFWRDTPLHTLPDSTLLFFGDGSTNGGVLTLRHGSRTLTITVEWLTGRVRE